MLLPNRHNRIIPNGFHTNRVPNTRLTINDLGRWRPYHCPFIESDAERCHHRNRLLRARTHRPQYLLRPGRIQRCLDSGTPRNQGAADRPGRNHQRAGGAGLRSGPLDMAQMEASELDLIVLATATPDRPAPASACMVQEKLGAHNAAGFDIAAVCSGALFALTTACQYIESGFYRNVMVIGADTFSNIIDWDRRDSVFFGDGAGALLLSATEEDRGFIGFDLNTDGSGRDGFTVPAGGSERPASEETLAQGLHCFQMDGPAVYNTAIKAVPESIEKLLSKTGVSIDKVACMLPHQPSIKILEEVARRVGLPWEKVRTNMDRYANTSGGTIPIVLDETWRSTEFNPVTTSSSPPSARDGRGAPPFTKSDHASGQALPHHRYFRCRLPRPSRRQSHHRTGRRSRVRRSRCHPAPRRTLRQGPGLPQCQRGCLPGDGEGRTGRRHAHPHPRRHARREHGRPRDRTRRERVAPRRIPALHRHGPHHPQQARSSRCSKSPKPSSATRWASRPFPSFESPTTCSKPAPYAMDPASVR